MQRKSEKEHCSRGRVLFCMHAIENSAGAGKPHQTQVCCVTRRIVFEEAAVRRCGKKIVGPHLRIYNVTHIIGKSLSDGADVRPMIGISNYYKS